jgi:hypothetical protein
MSGTSYHLRALQLAPDGRFWRPYSDTRHGIRQGRFHGETRFPRSRLVVVKITGACTLSHGPFPYKGARFSQFDRLAEVARAANRLSHEVDNQ